MVEFKELLEKSKESLKKFSELMLQVNKAWDEVEAIVDELDELKGEGVTNEEYEEMFGEDLVNLITESGEAFKQLYQKLQS